MPSRSAFQYKHISLENSLPFSSLCCDIASTNIENMFFIISSRKTQTLSRFRAYLWPSLSLRIVLSAQINLFNETEETEIVKYTFSSDWVVHEDRCRRVFAIPHFDMCFQADQVIFTPKYVILSISSRLLSCNMHRSYLYLKSDSSY